MTTGYFNVTDLLNLKILSDKGIVDTTMLKSLIDSDVSSQFKKDMSDSVNYYESRHDILANVRQYYRDGQLQENKAKANYKIPHPFHKILIDEKTAYLTGNPITIGIAGEESGEVKAKDYRSSLMNILTEKFDDVVADWVSGASKKGVEWIHFYINTAGELKYVIVPAEQIIAVYDMQYQDRLLYVIRFYQFDFVKSNGKVERRYKVEMWSARNVEYWEQTDGGGFIQDLSYQYNPSPHWFEQYDTTGNPIIEAHSWGRVPFIPLLNNSEMTTDLKPIKALIDAYDKVKSGWANDLEDFTEVLYVIKGLSNLSQEASAGLSELAIVIKNIKEDGAISVDEDGDVKTIKAEVPVEARQKFLDITGREIIYFGEGSDVTADMLSQSHAPSGVALQFLYARLDMKANRMIRKLKSALKDFVWFVTEYINRTENKNFDYGMVTFTVSKNQIFNTTEKIQSLVSSQGILSKETILEEHPYVEDVQSELARIAQSGHFGDNNATQKGIQSQNNQ
jgi:SPP1 family phage portal protein